MIYLITKYAILFLLAAICGFLLGRWWVRRSLVDVTESYSSMNQLMSEKPWEAVLTRFDQSEAHLGKRLHEEIGGLSIPEATDLSGVELQLNLLRAKIEDIPQPDIPEVDLSGVNAQLRTLLDKVTGIPQPKIPDLDLSGVEQQIKSVTEKVDAIPQPEIPELDLSGVEAQLAKMVGSIEGIPQPTIPDLDLSSLERQLSDVAFKIENLPQPEIPEVDLSGVESQVGTAIAHIAAIPKPEAVDLSEVSGRLQALEAVVANIEIPEPIAPPSITPLREDIQSLKQWIENIELAAPASDLSPVVAKIDALDRIVKAIPLPKSTDLGPLNQKLNDIEKRIKDIHIPPQTPAVNLNPLQTEIREISQLIKSLPDRVKTDPVDLSPVNEKVEHIQQLIKAIDIPAAPSFDGLETSVAKLESQIANLSQSDQLSSIDQHILSTEKTIADFSARETVLQSDIEPLQIKLDQIENKVLNTNAPDLDPVYEKLQWIKEQLDKLIEAGSTANASTPQPPRLLDSADFGEKDDLKLISGVGPKLERLLNANGIYYFWQVASWSKADIKFIDDRLDVFKGRIGRDNWVAQAKKLRKEVHMEEASEA